MQTFISILRGINVSGQKKVLMNDLKLLFENLHFKNVTTYIQSGNVAFKCNESDDLKIAQKVEKAIFKKYNFTVPVIVRNAVEMKTIASSNPFLEDKRWDASKWHVTFLSEIPNRKNVESIDTTASEPDEFFISGKEIYLKIPGSYAKTKFSNQFFEKKLKVTATTRNWNTVIRLMEMCLQ